MTATTTEPALDRVRALSEALRSQILDVVSIDASVLDPILISMLARGHMLIEGIPGIGKTLLARTLARCIDCDFNRVQFTNDLMPSDIIGSMVWRPNEERFSFIKGPLFANLVLADEINRTSPRTLSCLLEAMENGRVTVEGKAMALAKPFLVLATRNPIEFHGTYPVPEAALDRFMMRVQLDYPAEEFERALYCGSDPESRLADITPVLGQRELIGMMETVHRVEVSDAVAAYCYRFVQASRQHEAVALGASPRAALMWLKAARARALLEGRGYVLPDDLKHTALHVLPHRIFLKASGDAQSLVSDLLENVAVAL